MEVNIFYIVAIIGLLSIISGTLMIAKRPKKRKTIFSILLTGGICLEIYSIYIQDPIFIILQGVYIITIIYGIIKIK